MKINNLLKNVRNIGLGIALVVGFLLISGSNVSAQYNRQNQNNDRYDNNGGKMYRMAVDKGYQDGLKKGLNDARYNHDSNVEGDQYYKMAERGYKSKHGSKNAFQAAYREGFSRGYNEAFQRYQQNNSNRRNRRHNN